MFPSAPLTLEPGKPHLLGEVVAFNSAGGLPGSHGDTVTGAMVQRRGFGSRRFWAELGSLGSF